MRKFIFLIMMMSLFIGCGSGDNTSTGITEVTNEGAFLDSAVEGVKYKTSSGLEGYTNDRGGYNYKDGDKVEFFVGDVSLGETNASELLTTDNLPFPTKVAQFLQTLDADGIVSNGITIKKSLHDEPIFKKTTIKENEQSEFAQNLNIKDFSATEQNNDLITDVLKNANLEPVDIVSEYKATQHKEKSERLKRIKENNPELYTYIDGTFNTDEQLPSETNIHKMLVSRLAYYFYSKVYKSELDLKTDLYFNAMRNTITTQEKIEDFASSYLNIGALATEITVYTTDFISGQSDDELSMQMKNKIGSAIMTSGRSKVVDLTFDETGKSIVEAVDNCLPMIQTSWPSLNKLVGEQFNAAVELIFKDAQNSGTAVIDCAMGEVTETTGRFVNSYKGNIELQEYEYMAIAKKYLDVYFSCGYFNNTCMASKLGDNETLNDQLNYIMKQNQLDTGIDFSIRVGAKGVIDEYMTAITNFANDIATSLPSDAYFNYQDADRDTTSLDLTVLPLSIVNDDQGILWVNLDIENLSARDIYLTSFTPKFVLNGKEFTVASDFYGEWSTKLFNTIFTKTSSTKNIRIPISLNNNILPETGIARLVLEVAYMSSDKVISDTVQRVVDLDLAELWSSTKIDELDSSLITTSKNIDMIEGDTKYYLPDVYLGKTKITDLNDIVWQINPMSYKYSDLKIESDENGYFVKTPILLDNHYNEMISLSVYLNSSKYSEPAVMLINIEKKDTLLKDLIVGKTFYEKCGSTVYTNIFQIDGQMKWINGDGDGDSGYVAYTVLGDTLITTDEKKRVFVLKDSASNYINLEDLEGNIKTLYFNQIDAINAPNNSCDEDEDEDENDSYYDTKAQYTLNGNVYLTTNAIINMDAQACPQLQVNIKESDDEGADIVQFTTNYNSKLSFDNAFVNDKLTLTSEDLSFYLELGGDPQAVNDTSTFSVTFTKNSDGSYGIETNGYYSNKYEDGENKISEVSATSVPFDSSHGYGNDNCTNSLEIEQTDLDFTHIGNPTNALLYPNGGEVFTSGKLEVIKWDSTPYGVVGGTVDLYVLHDDPSGLEDRTNDVLAGEMDRNWYKFASNIPNSGEYEIDPEVLNGNGNAYIILIVYDDNTWDISDSTFVLTSN